MIRLEYEAYEPLALRAFAIISDEVGGRWPSARVAFHHRTGPVALGEASVVIAAASPRRADAFAACRYVIERVKQIAPVWKHEYFEDGGRLDRGRDGRPVRREGARGGVSPRMRVTNSARSRGCATWRRIRELVRAVPAPATVATVWQALSDEFPAVAPYARSLSAAVNAEFAKITTTVADGDEVAFLPPVAGG